MKNRPDSLVVLSPIKVMVLLPQLNVNLDHAESSGPDVRLHRTSCSSESPTSRCDVVTPDGLRTTCENKHDSRVQKVSVFRVSRIQSSRARARVDVGPCQRHVEGRTPPRGARARPRCSPSNALLICNGTACAPPENQGFCVVSCLVCSFMAPLFRTACWFYHLSGPPQSPWPGPILSYAFHFSASADDFVRDMLASWSDCRFAAQERRGWKKRHLKVHLVCMNSPQGEAVGKRRPTVHQVEILLVIAKLAVVEKKKQGCY